jgi:dTDP-4-amino-4,6-dideoxygalactose transaminase
MKIPFCLPTIDEDVINEMHHTLTVTGWLTSGPKKEALEKEIKGLTGVPEVLCVNSWTSGAMLILKWFGVGPGDEVIIPAYTYSATALAVMNIGATPVMVDVTDEFTIDTNKIRNAINTKTKAIIPVDMGGWPSDYDGIMKLVKDDDIQQLFNPSSNRQYKLNRILVLSDAAHSIGATINGVQSGNFADISIFSFHSVKNITTGEGGAICLNLPSPFKNEDEYLFLRSFSLNGQTKSALEKNQPGAWKYDIVDHGLKANMPDLCASVGLAQIRKYKDGLLPERIQICDFYSHEFRRYKWAMIPPYKDQFKSSSCHLYLLRIKDATEVDRDRMIQKISEVGVGVNVHYIPMPMLTLFKNLGYNILNYPQTYNMYKNEISLPVYNGLSKKQLRYIVESVVEAYNITFNK